MAGDGRGTAGIELRDLRAIARELVPAMPSQDHAAAWWMAGQLPYGAGAANPSAPSPLRVLDETSRALVVRLHNAGSTDLRSSDEELRAMTTRLEQTIVADSALNQLRVRPQISRQIVRLGGHIEFAALNGWICDQVFRTPREDRWLGLVRRDVFTGLAGDGVVVLR